MTCRTLREGDRIVGHVCGPGPYTHRVRARCPFCCLGRARTIHASREVFGGYCAPDLVCGRCGQEWSPDDARPRVVSQEQRAKNRALVAGMREGR